MRKPANVSEFLDSDAYLVCARMRPDEIEQYIALISVDGNYDHQVAARGFINAGGVRYTMLGKDGPVMIGGCFEIGHQVYQGWMAATRDGWDGGGYIGITKATRWLHAEMFAHGVQRIEIACLAHRLDTCEWYERSLGFQCEGVQRRKGRGGEDVALYAKVKGG